MNQGDLIGRNQEDKYSDLTVLPPSSLLLGLPIGGTQLEARGPLDECYIGYLLGQRTG